MKQKIIFFITLLILVNLKAFSLENVNIVFKIDEEIITNIDVKKEAKFLVALNTNLETLNEKKLTDLAKKSIIKETIKKKELLKYFELNQEDPNLDSFLKNFYIKLNLNNLSELEVFLNTYDLTIESIKKKIEIDHYWNKLIFEKYKNQIDIDKNAIIEKIAKRKLIKDKKIYELSEIIFEKDQNVSLKDKVDSFFDNLLP